MTAKNCIFPPCPKCGDGYLVPVSDGKEVVAKWVCTNRSKREKGEVCNYNVDW